MNDKCKKCNNSLSKILNRIIFGNNKKEFVELSLYHCDNCKNLVSLKTTFSVNKPLIYNCEDCDSKINFEISNLSNRLPLLFNEYELKGYHCCETNRENNQIDKYIIIPKKIERIKPSFVVKNSDELICNHCSSLKTKFDTVENGSNLMGLSTILKCENFYIIEYIQSLTCQQCNTQTSYSFYFLVSLKNKLICSCGNSISTISSTQNLSNSVKVGDEVDLKISMSCHKCSEIFNFTKTIKGKCFNIKKNNG